MVVYVTATLLTAILIGISYKYYKKTICNNLLLCSDVQIKEYKKNKRLYILFFILSVIPLTFVSGFRWGVGTDYFYGYYPTFYGYYYGFILGFTESFYNFLIDLIKIFSNDTVYFFIFTSLIYNFLMFLSIRKMSKNWIISAIMLVAGNFFFISLNNIRQACAMAAATVAFAYACEKKILPFSFFAILTYMLHHSSIIMILPCAFIILKKMKKIYPIFAIILLIATPLYLPFIKWIISFTEYANYFNWEAKDSPLFPYILLHGTVFIVSFYMYRKINDDKYGFPLMLMNLVTLIISLISIEFPVNETMSRGCLYFSWSIIFLVPYFMEATPYKWINIIILILVIVVACGSTWYTSVYLGHHEVFPYRFIFAKDWFIW